MITFFIYFFIAMIFFVSVVMVYNMVVIFPNDSKAGFRNHGIGIVFLAASTVGLLFTLSRVFFLY